MKKVLSLFALTLAVGALQPTPETEVLAQGQAQPQEVRAAIRHDTSIPLAQMPAKAATSTRQNYDVKAPSLAPPVQVTDQAEQRFAVSPIAALPSTGFDGVGEGNPQFFYNVNSAPPDTVGEAGLTQYVQWVNTAFAVFDKATGTRLYGPAAGNTLWTGFGGPCENRNDGDPIVQYDQLADRWILTQFAVQLGNYQQCVAISTTSDALGSWHRYSFGYTEFPDYPKLSVWPDGYYITFNMFGIDGSTFSGGRICAYDRARMLAGLSATQICVQNNAYSSPLVADLEGKTLPPPGTPTYVLNRSTTGIRLWRFSVNFTNGTSSITGPTALPVAAYTAACTISPCIPQPGTAQALDSLGDRLMYRASYRNLGSRTSLLASHSVASGGVVNIRWYEFDVTGPTATVRQQSTYAPNDGSYRWMPSIAMDNVGNIAVGYSVSSSTVSPSIRFAGREVNDPPSTLSLEDSMQVGSGSQQSLSRWGDYSSMSIDPVDDCTFWYTSEFLKASGNFNWSTRISSFKFVTCGSTPPPPGFALGVTPSSRTVTQGQSTTFGATVTSQNGYNGSGSFSVTGLPANTSASFSPTGYTGGSGSSTLTINTTSTTPTGSHQLTITATDTGGTPTQSTIVTLTVNPVVVGGGLVGHWAFDETSGATAADSSGNGNTGTLVNGQSWNPAGRIGGALSFDGVNDYVSLGNPASLIPGNAITLAGWVNFNSVSGNPLILAKDDVANPQNGTYLRLQSGTGIGCAIGGTFALAPASLTVGAWNHLACTYDGASVRVYVNGVQLQTVAKTGPIADDVGTNWLIGARRPANPSFFLNGLLDDIRIYNRALGTAEISQLFTGNSPSLSLGVTPPSQTATQGQAPTFTATVTGQNGYTGNGSFSVTGLPANTTASFSPTGYTAGSGSSTLTVTTTSTTPTGSHPLTVTATDSSGTPTESTIVTLTVNAAPVPGFTLNVTPPSQSVTQGQGTTFGATITSQNGYNGTGAFSVTGLPANTTASFSPTGYTGGSGSSTLTVNTTSTTPVGSHQLTVTATDTTGTPTHSSIVTLSVNPVVTSGLIGHWAFDETAGATAADSSGNGNTGTLVNGQSWNPAGRIGGALSFDGVNDYVSLGNPASLIPGNAITLAGWVNFNSVSGNPLILAKDDVANPQNGTYLRLQSGTGVGCAIGGTFALAPASLTVGAWNHLACTYDGASVRVYVNGVQLQTVAKTGPIADDVGTNWLIGARRPANPGFFLNGLLDDIRIYNRALSGAEISNLSSMRPSVR